MMLLGSAQVFLNSSQGIKRERLRGEGPDSCAGVEAREVFVVNRRESLRAAAVGVGVEAEVRLHERLDPARAGHIGALAEASICDADVVALEVARVEIEFTPRPPLEIQSRREGIDLQGGLPPLGCFAVVVPEFAPDFKSLRRLPLLHQQRGELELRFLGGIFQLRHAAQNLDRLAGLIHPAEDRCLFAEQRGGCLVPFFKTLNALERLSVVACGKKLVDLLPSLQQRLALQVFGLRLQFRSTRRFGFCGQFLGLCSIQRGEAGRCHGRHLRIPRSTQLLEKTARLGVAPAEHHRGCESEGNPLVSRLGGGGFFKNAHRLGVATFV